MNFRKITCKVSAFEPEFNRMTPIEISVVLEFPEDTYPYVTMIQGKAFILSALMLDESLISNTKSEPVEE